MLTKTSLEYNDADCFCQLCHEIISFYPELAKGATQAIARIKDCLRMPTDDTLGAGLNRELEGIAQLFMHTEDCKEGITAFNEKRPPSYKGR